MIPPCPHVSAGKLADTWGVSVRTVQRWLGAEGITPTMHGRYRVADVERYAEKYGKTRLTAAEVYEVRALRTENESLRRSLARARELLQAIAQDARAGGV